MNWNPLGWIRKIPFMGRQQPTFADNELWKVRRLGQYNAEKMRGIVHTEEYAERMKEVQQWFDEKMENDNA